MINPEAILYNSKLEMCGENDIQVVIQETKMSNPSVYRLTNKRMQSMNSVYH